MINKFEDVMSKCSDKELLQILTSLDGDYQSEALEAAKIEFSKRNLSETISEDIKKEIQKERIVKHHKANKPLDTHWKVIAFLFPIIYQLFVSAFMKSKGYERGSKELLKWTLFGIVFYSVLIFLLR